MRRSIVILGGGAGAHMLAADLKQKGHRVAMYIRPQARGKNETLFADRTIHVTGQEQFDAQIDCVTDQIDAALQGAEYVILAAPAFMRQTYIDLLTGRIRKDQLLLLFPGSFGSLVFRKALGADAPVIVDADTLPYNVRLVGPATVNLVSRNRPNLAFLPADAAEVWFDRLCRELHPYHRVYREVLECGLCNVNPALHLGICLLNVGPVEREDVVFHIFSDGLTPASARLTRAIDYERKAIAEKLGYCVSPTEDFLGIATGYTWQAFYDAVRASGFCRVEGPNGLAHRFFTDDIPHGLVTWQSLARSAGVPTPSIDAAICIFNIIYERDWAQSATTSENMGIADLSPEALQAYLKTGKS